MANLTSVTGFYYQIGSIDYPLNFSPDDKFGFDSEGQENAVFKYSINDVEKAVTDSGLTSKDFAAVTKSEKILDNDKEEYSIRYTEIIALLVKEVQDLKAEVKKIKENINNENY